MNTYIVNLMKIDTIEDGLQCNKTQQGAYFMNLSDAVYFIQNKLNDDSVQNKFNYVVVLGIPMGQMNVIPTELYVFTPSVTTNSYDEVNKEASAFKFIAEYYKVQLTETKPVINLDLSKEELIPTKEFVSSLKENIENKDYGKVREMIEQKEATISSQINGFLENVANSLNSVDEAVNNLFDVFNGKF